MSFTTTVFLFLYLPVFLLLYFLIPELFPSDRKNMIRNIILIICNIIFCVWSSCSLGAFLLVYALAAYFCGIMIFRAVQRKSAIRSLSSSPWYIAGICTALLVLFYFKYFYVTAQYLTRILNFNATVFGNITAPIGISFITFSLISYFTDISLGYASPGSLGDCLLYIFFFPKVASGPTVLWRNFQPQLGNRHSDTSLILSGFNRISIGFAKKLILADTFGTYAAAIQGAIDTPTAWFGWILYAMQIYYDFSGYSDMAIGLARLFGFKFDENFNFPYRSLSVTEFWRRWHISLGSFFRNYIYFPLGGNRKGKFRTLVNLSVVFLVTGIWHGAGMAYIIWGMIHGLCVVFERIVKDKTWYRRIPGAVKWAGTFFISSSAWQFFRYGSTAKAVSSLANLFGIRSYESSEILRGLSFYSDTKITVLLIIGIIGATVPGDGRIIKTYDRLKENTCFAVCQEIILVLLFIVSISFMTGSTFQPFIYFQF